MNRDYKFNYLLCLLFCFGWILIYANRTVLSPVLATLEQEWAVSKTFLGMVNSGFLLVYAISQIPIGVIADKLNRKNILLGGYLIHGIGATLSGLAFAPISFLASRLITGFGQASYYSTQFSIVSAVTPHNFRNLTNAIITSGMSIGMAVGFITGSFFFNTLELPWRFPIIFLGILTLLVFLPMSKYIPNVRVPKKVGQGFLKVNLNTNLKLIFLASLSSVFGLFFLISWLPYYLQKSGVMSDTWASILPSFMCLMFVPGALISGYLSDNKFNKKYIMIFSIILSMIAFSLLMSQNNLFLVCSGILLYGAVGHMVIDPLMITVVADNADEKTLSSTFGIKNFCTMIGAVLAPGLAGVILDLTSSFQIVFICIILIESIALVSVAFLKDAKT